MTKLEEPTIRTGQPEPIPLEEIEGDDLTLPESVTDTEAISPSPNDARVLENKKAALRERYEEILIRQGSRELGEEMLQVARAARASQIRILQDE